MNVKISTGQSQFDNRPQNLRGSWIASLRDWLLAAAMAGLSQYDPLFGSEDSGVRPQRRAVFEATRVDNPYGCEFPEWVRARPPTKAAPSAQSAIKPISPTLNGALNGERSFPKQLLTVAETAYLFQVSEKTIRRMMARGELPAVRLGRSVRIDPEVIERIVYRKE